MREFELGLLAVVLAALLVHLLRRARAASARRTVSRLGYFDAVAVLFADARTSVLSHGFPRLAGRWRDRAFTLSALPDALGYRKLPALWVSITLAEPQPVAGTLDILMRPSGLEPFTGFAALPCGLAPPAGCPEHAAIKSDRPVPPVAAADLAPHLAVFDDPAVKELLITPRGLRVTLLAEEADRTRYLLFRDAELGAVPLSPDRLVPLLDRLIALADSLREANVPPADAALDRRHPRQPA